MQDHDLALDNLTWSNDEDSALSRIPIKGSVYLYNHRKFGRMRIHCILLAGAVLEGLGAYQTFRSYLDKNDPDLVKGKPLGAVASRFNILKAIEKRERAVFDPKGVIGNDAMNKGHLNLSLRPIQELRLKIHADEDINARNNQMLTPLHIAAQRGLSSVLEALITCKADVMAIDKEQKSVLDFATRDKCKNILKSYGADGWQPLMIAAEAGEVEGLKLLLASMAEVNMQSKDGTTPLHVAAQHGHREAICLLLSAKADLNVLDHSGKSPFDVADNMIHLPEIHKHVLLNVTDHKDYGCDLCSRTIADGVCYSCSKCGFDMCMTCFKQQKAGCRLNLQLQGADGWTLLMVAAERGSHEVEMYLRYREALLCVKNHAKFSQWFKDFVHHCENLQQMDWTWQEFEPLSMAITDEKLTVQKVGEPPDYSCVLGSYDFQQGIHIWKVLVKNVRSMWLGIARGVKEQGGLGSYPGNQSEYMLAFGSADCEPVISGLAPIIEKFGNAGFASGQIVEFELDCKEHTLKMNVDGNTVVHAKNIGNNGVSAYVCMDYEESATIVSRTAIMGEINGSSNLPESDREAGFSNSAWSDKDDNLLSKELLDGIFSSSCALESN